MNPRYTRTRDMITAPEVPRMENGGVALCHFCQRDVYFADGFMNLLIKIIETPYKYRLAINIHQRGEL